MTKPEAASRFSGITSAVCILLLLVTPGVTSCDTLSPRGAVVPFENTIWILEKYGQPGKLKSVIGGIRITAVFASSEKRVHGSSGCNNYSSDYQILEPGTPFEGGLETGSMMTTLLDCGKSGNEQADAFLEILGSAVSYKVEGRILTITGSRGILVFWP